MTEKDKKISKNITYFLFIVFFFIGSFTFTDYGMWIDEEFQRSSGFYWLNYILSFTSLSELKDLALSKSNQISGFTLPLPVNYPYYGIIFDVTAALLELILKINDPKNYFYFRHFLNFIFFFIGTVFFYKLLLNRFLDYNISLVGTLFFILSPRIYGASFFNNKDVVFLSLFVIGLYFLFKTIDKFSYKNILIFSIFAAVCTAHRILGILLPLSFIIFYSLSVLSKKENFDDIFKIPFLLFFYFIFLILLWPVLWSSPIENFISAFKFFSNQTLEIRMLFNQEYVFSNFLPFSYNFLWIFITTPILYLMLFLIGYFQIFRRFLIKFLNIKEKTYYYDLWRGNSEKKDLLVLVIITIVIIYLTSFDVILYNGWRHTYFINIFMIYIATHAFYRINIFLKKKSIKNVHYYITILFLVSIIYKMISYHPFQNTYFNNYFNKISHENFEVDYDGLSGKRFLEQILILESGKKSINIGVASWYPLERSIQLLDRKDRKKINVVGQNFEKADYLYTNFISEVEKTDNYKYKIPSNFTSIDKFILNNIVIYEVFKKNN